MKTGISGALISMMIPEIQSAGKTKTRMAAGMKAASGHLRQIVGIILAEFVHAFDQQIGEVAGALAGNKAGAECGDLAVSASARRACLTAAAASNATASANGPIDRPCREHAEHRPQERPDRRQAEMVDNTRDRPHAPTAKPGRSAAARRSAPMPMAPASGNRTALARLRSQASSALVVARGIGAECAAIVLAFSGESSGRRVDPGSLQCQ